MSSDERSIQRPLSRGYGTTTGGSFDREMAGILWRRTRLIFWSGLVASGIVFAMNRLYGIEPIPSALVPWRGFLHLLHPLSFAAGLAAVHLGERDLDRTQRVAFWVVLFNILLVIPNVAAFYPPREAFLPVGLLLFVHAAFVPHRNTQAWLAGSAVAMTGVALWVLPLVVPELATYWESIGSRAAFFERAWQVVGIGMIAGVSIMVSRNLYALQRSAHRAKRLGNYLIEKELGEGGMGRVYVARHALICRPTAVKVMSDESADGNVALARFEREVRLSASLTHPNTITIFDFGRTSDNTFYYAMEYLDGLDLQRMVERFGPLLAERVVYLLRQVCGSLAEAHARGIVHRDIKPSNIFVTQRGGLYDFVKVLDFGLAREQQGADETSLTKTGMVFGTPRYIAPESVYGAHNADARSDVYNVGGVAYWMLTGRPLFAGSSSLDLIIDHVKTVPARPGEVSELPIPKELDDVVMRCLEKEPSRRFASATALDEALRAVPLEERWSQARAREWWTLHAPEALRAAEDEVERPPEQENGRRTVSVEAASAAE
ncbi:MAG: serine/threonine-protein kinase [Gemmatimonadota bacterium]